MTAPTWVFFDVDQTLCDFATMMERALAQTAALIAARYPRLARGRLTSADLQAARNRVAEASPQLRLLEMRRLSFAWALEGTTDDPAAITEVTDFYRDSRYRDPIVFDDVEPALARLQGRVRLGTISNGNSTLELLGLHGRFEREFAAESLGFVKPDRRIFDHAASVVGASPEQLVMVGDSYAHDVAGADAAGWRGIWLRRDRPPGPPTQIRSLLELPELLFG